jgi:hypothetical protein
MIRITPRSTDNVLGIGLELPAPISRGGVLCRPNDRQTTLVGSFLCYILLRIIAGRT